MNQLKEQKKLRNSMDNSIYPTFMNRAGALLLDSFIFMPVLLFLRILFSKINANSAVLYSGIIVQLLNIFLSNFYRIFFNTKFNGTPGKLIFKYKIVREDGLPVTWATSLKRELIYIITSLIYLILFYTVFFMNREEIYSFRDASEFYSESSLSNINTLVMFIIYFIDFGRANSSLKRQTLHDKIAKTLVVYRYTTK